MMQRSKNLPPKSKHELQVLDNGALDPAKMYNLFIKSVPGKDFIAFRRFAAAYPSYEDALHALMEDKGLVDKRPVPGTLI